MADYTIRVNAQDNTRGTFSNINSGLAGMTANAGRFRAALGAAGAALAAFGVANVIQDTIDDFDALAKSARTAGAAASEDAFRGFQVLKQAMNEAGIDAATFDRAMLQTTSRLQEGLEGGEAFSEIFQKLGDSVTTANGELAAGPDLLQAMINALNEGTISTDEFAKVVGGRAGPLIQQQFASLNTDAETLAATLADVEANSNIVSLDAANNAEVFNDNIGRLKEGMGQLLTDAITPLLPHLVRLSEEIMANMPAIVQAVQTAFQNLEPVFNLIGTVLTELVFPIMQRVFEVLGFIANAISPLVETAIPGLKAAFEGIVAIVERVVGFFQGVAEGLQNIYNKAMQLKDGVVGGVSGMADGVTQGARDMYEGATSWANQMYQEWWGGSIFPDLRDGVISAFRDMATGAIGNTQRMVNESTVLSNDFAKTIEEDFAGTLQSALSDGKLELNDFRGFFANTMTQLVNHALSGTGGIGQAFSSLFGGGGGGGFLGGLGGMFGGLFGGGGGGGGFLSGIGSFFGGLFADGGYLPSGKFGIAGEAGPEIITGPARIHSNADSFGGGTTINFNISALDAKDATQVIMENKNQIIGIVQSAGHRRGKEIF